MTMSGFKADVYKVCAQVAEAFPGWKFSAGSFRKVIAGCAELVVDLGLYFKNGFSDLQPHIVVRNKKFEIFFQDLFCLEKRQSVPVSSVSFQAVDGLFEFTPESKRRTCVICQDKEAYVAAILGNSSADEDAKARMVGSSLSVLELHQVLVAMLKDGISFIDRTYDLRGEDELLRGLPAKYESRGQVPYAEMEKGKGVVLCAVKIMIGDFDFVEKYASEEFVTVYPKRTVELERMLQSLPMLKKRFVETGSLY
ncbi:hypothetical protein [Pseudomonas putida]